jgi:hypothetical protein
LRTLLSHLLLESFLEPGSTDDIAAELVICCSKAFPDLSELSKIAPSVEVEDQSEEVPPVMDVLLDVLLSLLAKGSTPVRLSAEKVSLSMICYVIVSRQQCLGFMCPEVRPLLSSLCSMHRCSKCTARTSPAQGLLMFCES